MLHQMLHKTKCHLVMVMMLLVLPRRSFFKNVEEIINSKRKLPRIIQLFLLRKDPIECCIHPSPNQVKKAILEDFGVLTDLLVCKVFNQAWRPQSTIEPGLQSQVFQKICDTRSHYIQVLKELYCLLKIPKPPGNKSIEVKDVWIDKLLILKEGNTWRCSHDGSNPYGFDAVHGAISIVLAGSKYPRSGAVGLLLCQAAFFIYIVSNFVAYHILVS